MRNNVLIVNESLRYAESLKKMVLDVNPSLNIILSDNVKEAYKYIMNVTIDLFILDVLMNVEKPDDISGIRLAEQIREINKYVLTPMIFVTSAEDPELYAYEELNCLGYFAKPFSIEKFKTKLKKALYYRTARNENKALIFRRGGSVYPIQIKDIAFIESVSHSLRVHLGDGTVVDVLYKTYNDLLNEADSEYLFQCERGIVANKSYILCLDIPNRSIILKNDLGRIGIGSTYKKRIKDTLGELII